MAIGHLFNSTRRAFGIMLIAGSMLGFSVACGPDSGPDPVFPIDTGLIVSPTSTATPTPTPINHYTPTASPTSTATPTPRPINHHTPTASPTSTATPTPRPINHHTPTASPTSTATPTPEPTPAFTATPTPEPTQAPVVGVVLPDIGLNVRDAPSVDEGVIQYVAHEGDELQVTGEQSEQDGIVWMRLVDGNWVQRQYLEFAADPTKETAPIVAVVLPDIGLNVRTAPNTVDSTISYVVATGSELILTGRTVEAEGVTWHKIDDGNWVQAQFLDIGQ